MPRRRSLATPVHRAVVDADELVVDAVLVAVLVDRLAALLELVVVVDDAEAAALQLRVQRDERVDRRRVEVAVEAEERDLLDGRRRQRLGEEALEEEDAVVEQPEARKVRLDVVGRCR